MRKMVCTLALVGLAACASEPEVPSAEPSVQAERQTVPEAEILVYETNGVVRSITPTRSHVVIRHDDIPGFMDAMTMPFAVGDTAVVRGLVPGDSIAFTFAVEPAGAVLREVERL